MPPNVLTDLIDAETRRRILEDNEDLVAPLPGIVVSRRRRTFEERFGPRPKPKPARGRGRRGRPPRGGGRRGRPTPVATRPDLQPGERAPAPQPVRNPNPRATGSTSYNQPVPGRPDLLPGQRPPRPPAPQPPEETPEQGFLGNVWEGVKSAFEAGTATGRPQWLENMDLEPGQPAISALPGAGARDFGEPPPSQFAPHPLEGLGVQEIFETGTLDMKQQLLEDIRDWEDVVYGGQRQDPLTGLRNEYLQDPRFVVTDLTATEIEDIVRELGAWEDDFGPYVPEDEGDLYLGEELGLIEEPEGDGVDEPEGDGGLDLPEYPDGNGGGGYPPGYAVRTPNRRQSHVGLVSWRI